MDYVSLSMFFLVAAIFGGFLAMNPENLNEALTKPVFADAEEGTIYTVEIKDGISSSEKVKTNQQTLQDL